MYKFKTEETQKEQQQEEETVDLSQFMMLNDMSAEPAKLRLICLYG